MTTDAFHLLSGVISQGWRFFTSWHLPGTHATPGEMAMFVLAAHVTLRFFVRVAQVSSGDAHSDKVYNERKG